MQVLAESGTRGLSFRAVAKRLGGSTTLITHYFPTQRALIDELTTSQVDQWREQIRALDVQSDDPLQRLHDLLVWLIPVTEIGLNEERSRIHLLSGHLLGEENRAAFVEWDRTIRGFIRTHLTGLVPKAEIERTVDLLRATANGVVLTVVEHPESWPPERQIAIIDRCLSGLGLLPSTKKKRVTKRG